MRVNVFEPALGDEELEAVREVFASRWIGRGSRVDTFERMFAEHLGVDRGQITSTNSCTEATFIAMELLDVGPGDEVVLPAVSFVGAANAVAARGARPVFCDVDSHTLNPTVEHVRSCLTPATKAVVVLHYAGNPGAIAGIAQLCEECGVKLIEDAANAIASRVDGRACGTFGDLGVWSFDHGKIVSAVDGGMLYARDPDLAARAAKLAYLGMEQTSGYAEAMRSALRWWDFEVTSFSRRSVLNDVLGAIGCVQLGKLEKFVARRREVAAHYDTALAAVPGLRLPARIPSGYEHSYFLYPVQMSPGVRDQVAQDLLRRGIYTTFRYRALHTVRAYGSRASLPGAERAAASTLCLPQHQALSDEDLAFVSDALTEALAVRHTCA
ncbi:DegT/DnrJ/EryC1/StrS family aminotransferase [Nocardia transvalensis]|uniref:DegT/DnrJ/EryC1/StrS family aminotransferase n=1 Tax=Nocardia transvalensis TaxID=37333 RepID=UPI0018943DA2|nr:DegT/DnrJ/EryC1/StrS family aminotransferase [Nocardia transvalensis]MBF6331902.1 DegT/DnrJ/EryC1/StrS family aminotransferase [Nocardia transvalensis]